MEQSSGDAILTDTRGAPALGLFPKACDLLVTGKTQLEPRLLTSFLCVFLHTLTSIYVASTVLGETQSPPSKRC